MRQSIVRCLTALACVLLLESRPLAQTAAPPPDRGGLRGTVLDPRGDVVPGVTVTAKPVGAGTSRSAVTDARGVYAFPGLAPGEYELRAVLAGFGSAALRATVAGGSGGDGSARAGGGAQTTADITLALAGLSESVTVTRTVQDRTEVPGAVSTIQGEDIQLYQRRASPAEAFEGIPGFLVENRRNFSLSGGVRLAIRTPLPRLGMRSVQIVQDGVPMTVADGTTEPTNIDLGSLGQVEVLRGPNSVLYGNAAGGVITLRTEYPASGHLSVQPDVQWGSYGFQQQQLKVHGTSGRVSYLVNASNARTDGFREHSASEVRRANVVVRAALSPDTELRGVFNVYDLPFGESASTLTAADARERPRSVRPQALTEGWGESTRQSQMGLSLEHRLADGHVFRATGWTLWRDVWNPIPFSVVDLGRHASGLRSEYAGAARVARIPLTWTTGFDVSKQHDDRMELVNAGVPEGAGRGARTRTGAIELDQLEDVLSVSPFLRVTAELTPRWHLTAGARYDRYEFTATDRFDSDGDQSGSRVMDAGSPMVGLTYLASDWLNVYGNFSTAYQTPTTVELSNQPSGAGGFNQDLQPERLRSGEVGVRGAIAPLHARFELAAYRSRLVDGLVRFDGADERSFFRNAGETSRNGIETMVEWSPTARLKGHVAYTYQDFMLKRFVAPEGDFSGKREPGAPAHQAFVGGSFAAPFGLFTAARLRFVGGYPVDSANTAWNESYSVTDLRWGFERRWKGASLRPFFGIDNVFDTRYNSSAIVNSTGGRYFEPAPGRELYVGLTVGTNVF